MKVWRQNFLLQIPPKSKQRFQKQKMRYNHSSVRVRGQRSILSTFVHRAPANDANQNKVNDCKERLENGKANRKRSTISLSDFLDRKLQKTSDQSKSVQGKAKPFLSPGTSVGANQVLSGANADQNTEGQDLNGTLDIVLEQFKHNKENEDNIPFSLEDSIQSSTITRVTKESQIQDPGKQTNGFEGLHGKPLAPKGLVVLGGDPVPKRAKYPKSFIRKEKTLPVYNHYASGSGWWDSDMEGVDNDEVGFNEVWEGVGSATIGGLDWH